MKILYEQGSVVRPKILLIESNLANRPTSSNGDARRPNIRCVVVANNPVRSRDRNIAGPKMIACQILASLERSKMIKISPNPVVWIISWRLENC